MTISDGGELYVGSFGNDRVAVFALDGTFLRSFSHASLDGPNCIAFDSAGNVYVSSAATGEVLKFDAGENFLFAFTGGGLASPMSIARDTNDVLYVSGGSSNNIVRFDTDGNMLGTITHGDLPAPQGVAFDERGHFFSSSFSAHMVVGRALPHDPRTMDFRCLLGRVTLECLQPLPDWHARVGRGHQHMQMIGHEAVSVELVVKPAGVELDATGYDLGHAFVAKRFARPDADCQMYDLVAGIVAAFEAHRPGLAVGT